MRLFLAVDLDDPARRTAAAVALRLSARIEGARLPIEVNWTAAEKLHLTLRFLGQVEGRQGERLREALVSPLGMAPFEATLGGAGAFPASGSPRVLWFGVADGSVELANLYRELERRLAAAAFAAEPRPFAAHLTVARLRRPCSGPANAALRLLLRETVVAATWRVDRVTLYESRLSPQGATYLPVQYVPLTDRERISEGS